MDATGLLMDVKRYAVHDGPGLRTTLFLKGCPLTCLWCHNPEGMSARPEMAFYSHKCVGCGRCAGVCRQAAHSLAEGHAFLRANCMACGACEAVCLGEAMKRYGRRIDVAEGLRIALEDRAFYGSAGGVTFSGGEPLLQAAYVAELLAALRQEGIHTAVDTCGHVPWAAFEKVLPVTDLFLYDIKHIDPAAHGRLTGAGNERILQNLVQLSNAGAQVEVRIPLVPGCNDDEKTLHGMGALLGGLHIVRAKVLPYHAMARGKYAALGRSDAMPDAPSPNDMALERAICIIQSHGVAAVSGRA